ncbi:hypothetical protein MLD52_15900 [Puniceicoccaceae bacterium K14]|nr:hypothetical protein [Puniceicoccaceae bacterium K14]
MAKVDVDVIADVLINNQFEPDVISKLIKEIESQQQVVAEEEKATREAPVKKQWVVIVSDPRGTLPEDEDYVGFVAQIPESEDIATTTERLNRAAFEFNISKKGRKNPVKTVAEACQAVGQKFLKEQEIAIKTKLPVTVLRTDNKLPEITVEDE